MSTIFWAGGASRKIVSRIVVEGELVLLTPAHLGGGEADEPVDMPLLVDPLDGCTPLLSGASLAGALRSYLREREHGYRREATPTSASVLLFGAEKDTEKEGEQSPLVVDDALGRSLAWEVRAGVALDPCSRTAKEGHLFDLALWPAGTVFPLRFELCLREGDDAGRLKQALVTALAALDEGEITLGARKSRGYGQVCVRAWRIKEYDLTKPEGLLDWIKNGHKPLDEAWAVEDLKSALGVESLLEDRRSFFTLRATFALEGSLLIRSPGGGEGGPDCVHLHALQADGVRKPVLPGTSLAGALRARAAKILFTLGEEERGRKMVEEIFGGERGQNGLSASRLVIRETVVENARTDLVQSRVSIDRFTGGAREGLLFSAQPLFAQSDTQITVDLRLLNPRECEMGLLLLILKDLWMGDLPLGGEIGIGRGRLKGKEAELIWREEGKERKWRIFSAQGALKIEGERRELLEGYVRVLHACLKGEHRHEKEN